MQSWFTWSAFRNVEKSSDVHRSIGAEVKCEPRLVVGVGDEPVKVFVGAIVHLFGIHQPDGPEVVGLGPVELDAAADEAAVLLHDLLHLGLVGVL